MKPTSTGSSTALSAETGDRAGKAIMLRTATALAATATTLVLFPMVILRSFWAAAPGNSPRLQRKVAHSRDRAYREDFAGRRFLFRLCRLLRPQGRAEPAHGFGIAVGEIACHGLGALPPRGRRRHDRILRAARDQLGDETRVVLAHLLPFLRDRRPRGLGERLALASRQRLEPRLVCDEEIRIEEQPRDEATRRRVLHILAPAPGRSDDPVHRAARERRAHLDRGEDDRRRAQALHDLPVHPWPGD